MTEKPKPRDDETPDLKEALLPYYKRYIQHLVQDHNRFLPSHPDNMREEGHVMRTKRNQLGYSRIEIAERMSNIEPRTEISLVLLLAFEAGIVPPDDLPNDFHHRLNQALTPRA